MTRLVALTGAGISVASGLPTYTDESREKFAGGQTIEQMYELYWNDLAGWLDAKPNAAHLVLAEHAVKVITQNIDDLHRKAGSTELVELHGNLREFYCPRCLQRVEAAPRRGEYLTCPRDGERLRPNIVFYGESVHGLDEAMEWVVTADHLLVIGTSLLVSPAANLAGLAQYRRVPVTVIDQAAETEVPRLLRKLGKPRIAERGATL
jgi:NAD-dependent deacetylase